MIQIKEFEKILEYHFKNKNLLINALTHPSFKKSDFQILELLGDKVLNLNIIELIYNQEKSLKEHVNQFNSLVNFEALIKISQKLQIKKFLQHKVNYLNEKIFADTVESVIGAIFLDSNYETTYKIIKKHWKNLILQKIPIESKMELQEISQAKNLKLPIYKTNKITGNDHDPIFETVILVETVGEEKGIGNSKQKAEKNAASNFLKKYEHEIKKL